MIAFFASEESSGVSGEADSSGPRKCFLKAPTFIAEFCENALPVAASAVPF